jgi:hypothetical protein
MSEAGGSGVFEQSPVVAADAPYERVVVVHHQGNGMSVAGFVCGLLSALLGIVPLLFFVTFPLAVLGVIFGAIGWHRAAREPARGGKGLSIAGVVLGVLGFVFSIVGIILLNQVLSGIE